jgi:hypothetical protein
VSAPPNPENDKGRPGRQPKSKSLKISNGKLTNLLPHFKRHGTKTVLQTATGFASRITRELLDAVLMADCDLKIASTSPARMREVAPSHRLIRGTSWKVRSWRAPDDVGAST